MRGSRGLPKDTPSDGGLSGPQKESTWITGKRFEAAVSPNRRFADVVDRKEMKRLIMLDAEALAELRDLCQELIEFMGK